MIVKVFNMKSSEVDHNGRTLEWKLYQVGYHTLSACEWIARPRTRFKYKWGSYPLIFSFIEVESKAMVPKIEVNSTVQEVGIPDDPITIEEYIEQFTMPKRAKELVKIKQREIAINRFDL